MKYMLSIEQNLNRILCTRKYSLPLNPNFGLSYEWIDKPNINELEIVEEIKEQLSLFEPRIANPRIKVEKNADKILICIDTYKVRL